MENISKSVKFSQRLRARVANDAAVASDAAVAASISTVLFVDSGRFHI